MIKTRETDALLKQCKIKGRNPDPWKLCRKLERERDEARAERDEWIARFHADEQLIKEAMIPHTENSET